MENAKNRAELVPRNYQVELIRICVKENSIIFLPTGAGKTFIAMCALKQLIGDDFARTYSEGGKVSIFLVNTVTLVSQHLKYLQQNTPYLIGHYTGDMNVDFWDGEKWLTEFNSHNVLIMTAQILRNCLTSNFIDLNKVNVLICDECHHGVLKHPMRDIMHFFQHLLHPPRVIGLTATLLNGNVKTAKVLNQVMELETTFHAKVATVDALINVVGYTTNPKEEIILYSSDDVKDVITEACKDLHNLEHIIRQFKVSKQVKPPSNLMYLKKEKPFEKLYKLLMDASIHMEMLGVAGSRIACLVYKLHMELEKRCCSDLKTCAIINSIISLFTLISARLDAIYLPLPERNRALVMSSNKVYQLIHILSNFRNKSRRELCGIVFVKRKNTALLLYHLLNEFKKSCSELEFIKPDFIIGNTSNPLNCTMEALYYAKLNRKIMDKFNSKEVNLLFASNVIEEGIDVQICSLVIKFDVVNDYREYIQSKGRARHATSLYYVMVDSKERELFSKKYTEFKYIEESLNHYLIGSNEDRVGPTQENINKMYDETKIFFVDGHNSANITESVAMQILMMYCNSTKADMYTVYEPIFYVENGNGKVRVHLELPIFCPLRELIAGEFKSTKREAKCSAAYHACIKLFQCGELSSELLPNPAHVIDEKVDYLFRHWPLDGHKTDGVSREARTYARRVPKVMRSPIISNKKAYLHIINMNSMLDHNQITLNKLYSSDLCFGLLTANELPELCAFPIFVTLGKISIELLVNQNTFVFTESEISLIKRFHHLIFDGVLDILTKKSYLILGDNQTLFSYLVPVLKSTKKIVFNIITDHEDIIDISQELTVEEKQKLVVNNETYLEKIVTPNYRDHVKHHLVMEVCDYLSALSPFPNNEYKNYAEYYECKYDKKIVNKNLPMISVKPLSSNMNCLKPRGAAAKRKREEMLEMFVQHFTPELCVKQNFPAALWLSATLIPSVLYRIEQLLVADELRVLIAKAANLGSVSQSNWKPLEADSRLIKYKSNDSDTNIRAKENTDIEIATEMNALQIAKLLGSSTINKAFNDVMVDAQYPWETEKEPVDCWRKLDVSPLDIDLFAKFINSTLKRKTNNAPDNPLASQRANTAFLAINDVPPDYKYKGINLLAGTAKMNGPELRSVYEALSSAKAHEIVNLERLETLGDSFLKMAASLYVFNKFPNFTEGQATELKGKLVSNRNLFYLAQKHGFGGMILNSDFQPKDEWLPLGYCMPEKIKNMIQDNQASITSLFEIYISRDEQISGVLNQDTLDSIEDMRESIDEETHNGLATMSHYLGTKVINDKTLADAVEAIIGVYVESMGLQGGLKILQWLQILPQDAIQMTFNAPIRNPIIKQNSTASDIFVQLSNSDATRIENILGYVFKNRGFLLQALTHASYNTNRLTLSYQRLEFIGDAILDMLITLYIYENNTQLSPGDLTDLRSALVNNETFAAYVVKLGLHKYLKHYNAKLLSIIAKFEAYQGLRKNAITSDVLMLLSEDNLQLAENIDVPKVLGDLFESIIGAIFLDCGKDLEQVWRVVHRIMWRELESFSKDIPINPVRQLYETLAPLRPKFSEPVDVDQGRRTMMKLDFNLHGSLTRVHGFGDNKANAKKAAAKVALRLLTIKRK